MGFFITGKARIEQTEKNGYWKLIDNELYVDNDGTMLLTPRRFWSDSYTFPGFIMPLLGDKNKFDVRGAHQHDLACRFHQLLVVNLTLTELKHKRLIKYHDRKNIVICEDIPTKYLQIKDITKKNADDLLKRMMLTSNIDENICNIVRFGVNFNLNWYIKTGKRSLATYKIYKEDIGLVNGV